MRSLTTKLLIVILCCATTIPPGAAHSNLSSHGQKEPHSSASQTSEPQFAAEAQTAELLGIAEHVEKLADLKKSGVLDTPSATALREKVLRRILEAVLEVRIACSSIDADLAYTYDTMQRGQRTQTSVNNMFNLLNFLQFGILYSLEGRSRIQEKFIQSSVLTGISAGVGTLLPTVDILFNKFYKVKDTAPPKFARIKIGLPVDGRELPPLVSRFMDTPEPGTALTRRQSMYNLWQKRYGVDASKPGDLCSLIDAKSQSPSALSKRTLLLWSLHTYVEDFDQELLALLKSVMPNSDPTPLATSGALANLSATARDAAALLGCESSVEELVALNRSNQDSARRKLLELAILERALYGTLETLVASDKIFEELNYAYDVALSSMVARRGKWLQRTFEANFIHNGVAGSVATLLYLKDYTKAGNEVFVVSGGLGTALSSLALLQSHGGWRKSDTPPNSLADFFDLQPQSEYKFSPTIARFLNSPTPTNGNYKSRKEEVFALWKKYRATTINLKKQQNLEKLAAMPTVRWETIRILRNRIYCLDGLKAKIETLNSEILDLLSETQIGGSEAGLVATNPASGVPRDLLDLAGTIKSIQSLKNGNPESLLDAHLVATRKVLTAFLSVRVTASNLDVEIIREKQVLNNLTRDRDMVSAIINSINFFQINVLDMIIDGPLGLSSKPNYSLYGNRLTVVSGLLALGLASANFLVQKGGIRLSPSQPNMLGACFGMESKANSKYTPLLLKFLNTPQAGSTVARREELLRYWKATAVLNLDVGKESVRQKLAANGKKHRFWNETLRLLQNRLSMLTDVRAIVDQLDIGLNVVLKEVNE